MHNSKNIEQHLLEGATHIKILPNLSCDAKPIRPDKLNEYEAELWDNVISRLIDAGVATALDQASLESLIYWYSVYKKSQHCVDKITDYTSIEASRALSASMKAYENYMKLSKQFGLTAQSRNAITINSNSEVDDFLS